MSTFYDLNTNEMMRRRQQDKIAKLESQFVKGKNKPVNINTIDKNMLMVIMTWRVAIVLSSNYCILLTIYLSMFYNLKT